MITRIDALEDALERLAGYGYTDGPGFAVHAPMAAEALSTLGHDDLVAGWVEEYKRRHPPIETPPPSARLDPTDEASWRPALGDMGRVTDWWDLFERGLAEAPWHAVLQRWLPELLVGHGGSLAHGLLRTAHAVRALPAERPPSDLQLAELAHGLAFWAATFTVLPGRPALTGDRPLAEVLAELPRPTPAWTPFEAALFTRFDELDGFAAAVESLAAPPAHRGSLCDLSAAFCRTILEQPSASVVPLVHTITPISATRTLFAHLGGVPLETVYSRLWQAGAAVVCGFTPATAPPVDDDADAPPIDELIGRAVEHRDPHVLKFVEAAVREHTRRPDAVYRRAAQHVIDSVPAW